MTDGGGGRAFDVFVSHAPDGREWAAWIAWGLEEAGFRVRLDSWDVVAGTNRTHWLDGVVRTAPQTIAVVSDDYADSPWAQAEWGAVWAPRALGGDQRLLVARVTDRPVPGLLAQVDQIDLSGRNQLAAQAALLAAVRRREWAPGEAGIGGTGVERRSAAERFAAQPIFPGELPPVWNVPQPATRFVGRDAELAQLGEAVSRYPLVASVGLAGVGKTSLAAEHVRQQRADYDVVWWLPAGRPDLIAERVRALGPHLGLPAQTPPSAVLARLDASGGRWLMVLDDAAGPNTLPDWLMPSTRDGHILVTTRHSHWDQAGLALPIRPLERAASVRFLAARLPDIDQAVAADLAEHLGDLPLALTQIATLIDDTDTPADVYLTALRDNPAQVLARGEVPGRPGITAATLWDESIHRLGRDTPAAGELLRLAAHADRTTPLPTWLLALDPSAIRHPGLRSAAADPLELGATTTDVTRVGLAHRDGQGLALHSLVRTAVRADTVPEHAHQISDTLSRLLHTALPEDVTANPEAWPTWHELLPQAMTILEDVTPDADTPETTWLAEHAAAYLTEQGRPALAEPLAARAVEAHERLDGPDHPDTLTARNTYLRAALQADHYAAAGPLAERNADDRERILGPDHPDTLTSQDTLARVYHKAGHLDNAHVLFTHTLDERTRTLGPDHPDTLESRHRLGALLHDTGQSDEAADALQPVLVDRVRILGTNHPHSLDTRYRLATVYHGMGDYEDARALGEPALAARERILGSDHPDTLDSRYQIGIAYRRLGRGEDATRELGLALEGREQILGPDHPRTLNVAYALGRTHLDAERPGSAIPLLERTLDGRSRLLGPNHEISLQIRERLIEAYIADRQPGKATEHFEYILNRHERANEKDHPDTLAARDRLIANYEEIGRRGSARRCLEQQLAARERTDGPTHESTLRTAANLSAVCGESGRLPRAIELGERVHAARTRSLGPDHPDTQTSRTALADTYRRADRHTDAADLDRVTSTEESQQRPESPGRPELPGTPESRTPETRHHRIGP
ncbi:Tetratricopeptide repeat/TIR domain-containing protein [Frankia sp. AiPs1]|uniref:tetratricopeptide repeat protein n=1 Tax=Frankia sp. AiPa1 TaxID=573492 RepID=UPI00202B16C1|nr:toll/interleukin-1 receptor domain-containing protein [Frankia sp. AiPa1]MCL9759609.1 tetratricopeptide repeat protein [Frankia sp. AiPa1]